MKWEPISTAPRDGTLILVSRSKAIGFGHIKTSRFDGMEFESYNFAWNEDNRITLPCNDERRPTHWMPLPEPPMSGDGK